MNKKGTLVIVSGFSGAGKGTLMKKLMYDYDCYGLSISMTTRNPRPGETDGKEYFFVNKETFEDTIASDGLIEYACYCDNYYGTPRKYVEDQLAAGKDVILEIEIQGALKVKKTFPEALLVFVMAPSAKELQSRLIGRGTETAEVVAKRMNRAAEEAEGIEAYDAILINDDLDLSTIRLHELIQASHSATIRNKEFIENMRQELCALAKGEE